MGGKCRFLHSSLVGGVLTWEPRYFWLPLDSVQGRLVSSVAILWRLSGSLFLMGVATTSSVTLPRSDVARRLLDTPDASDNSDPSRLGRWVQQVMLLIDDSQPSDMFGFAVPINGDTMIAIGDGSHRGSAYIFARSGCK
ncbi:MAG TPA: hypothetical protein ENJ00_00060 [Phycisphaerales bacterium]|nr:hypothetical protein [Phycisphaerales bacterium]